MPAFWQRVVNTTMTKYIKGSEPATMRRHVLLASIQEKGAVTKNVSGKNLEWRVDYKRADLQTWQDAALNTFERLSRQKVATIDLNRAYRTSDMATKQEILANRGEQQIVNLYDRSGKKLLSDMGQQFNGQLYTDGYASGNSLRVIGIESMMGATPEVGKKAALNADTYAGLSTVRGAYGGSQTAGVNWPDGEASTEYDFFTPLVVDVTNATAWGSAGDTWAENANVVTRWGCDLAGRNADPEGKLDLVLMTPTMFNDFKNLFDTKERLAVERGADQSYLVKLGFTNIIHRDGVDYTSEYGCPSGCAYGWNFKKMELLSMQDQLFKFEGPYYDWNYKGYCIEVDFIGNVRFDSPRYFVKWGNITV